MTKYKLLILDVDGTLVGNGPYPSEAVINAVLAAKAKGITVALGTGRASEACYHLLERMNLNGVHVFFDGAAVVDWPSRDIVFLEALPPQAAYRFIELARISGLFAEIYAHDFYFIEEENELSKHQQSKLQLQPIVTDLISLAKRIKIVKGQVIATNEAQKKRADELTQQMESLCKISWSFDYSNGMYFGNAVSRFASKGEALRKMIDYLSLTPDQTIAIGDSFNDMSTFEVVQTAVAMGHAPDELKAMADWVAPSIHEDGVAAAIEQFLL